MSARRPQPRPDRRRLLRSGFATLSAALVAGCEPLSDKPWVKNVLGWAETLNIKTQRALLPRDRLAPEFSEADISDQFRANGSTDPQDKDYLALAKSRFSNWRLVVDGLVERPQQLSLRDLRAMPSRTQITRHDCVEGWSCIGKWTGVPLQDVLDRAGLKPAARYVVLHCFDTMSDDDEENAPRYYESIDLVDAAHPQTILAYEMNGEALPVPHGAPLRLRVERHLGYKMAKYLSRIEVVESFANIGGGNGSYWADRDYDWYAGI
jgi:DMSO/TMAO reductase YedYZ molybdopterin-dependent catalytic subunit